MLRVFSNNPWPRQEFPQWDIWDLQADLLFFYSHIANFLNDRCLWLGQPPERTGCTAVWHTLACAHTHTSKKRERENEALNERWQTSFFSLLWCTLGFCWTALALRCSCHVFCMRKWTKQKLIEESLGSLSCWKGMPSLMVQHFNLNHSLEEGGSCIRVTGIHSLLAPIKSIRWRREIGWSCFWYKQIGLIVPVSLSKWLPIIKGNTWIFTYISLFWGLVA